MLIKNTKMHKIFDNAYYGGYLSFDDLFYMVVFTFKIIGEKTIARKSL